MEILDHPDLEADLAAAALGFEKPACLHVFDSWSENPYAVLAEYSFAQWGEMFILERWSTIMVAWLEEFVPVVYKELANKDEFEDMWERQRNISFFQDAWFALNALVDMGPDYYWDSESNMAKVDRLIANQAGSVRGPDDVEDGCKRTQWRMR